MKVVLKKDIRDEKAWHSIMTERNIMTQLEFPFIVSLKHALQTETKLILVTELIGGGHLYYYIANLHCLP